MCHMLEATPPCRLSKWGLHEEARLDAHGGVSRRQFVPAKASALELERLHRSQGLGGDESLTISLPLRPEQSRL